MAEEVVLLSYWSSFYGIRAMIALEEKGIEYEFKEEDLLHNSKSPLLLQMNPVHKKIPVLIHNGKPVCESAIIVQYIDEAWKDKGPSLLPSDPYQRAQARFWVDFIEKKVEVAFLKVLFSKQPAEDDEGKKEFVETLKTLEVHLGDKPYFGGDAFGYVDVCLVPIYCWFYSLETLGKFSIEAECPKFIAYAERCLGREAVAKVFPDVKKMMGIALEVRKYYGID